MPLAGAQAVIFDCDGVLVDSETIMIAEERAGFARAGLVYDDATYLSRFVGLVEADWQAAIRADHAALGAGPFPEKIFDEIAAASRARMDGELQAMPGVAAFINGLSVPMAVASSSSRSGLARKLAQTGLAAAFAGHVYSGDEVAKGKPAPDLFLLAATRLGVAPPACVVIEDSVNGVRAGVAAGMRVIGFTGGGHADAALAARLTDAGAERVVARFEALV